MKKLFIRIDVYGDYRLAPNTVTCIRVMAKRRALPFQYMNGWSLYMLDGFFNSHGRCLSQGGGFQLAGSGDETHFLLPIRNESDREVTALHGTFFGAWSLTYDEDSVPEGSKYRDYF